MKTRQALFAYCLLAIVALLIWTILLSRQVTAESKLVKNAQGRSDTAGIAVDLGEQQIDKLISEQRESRLESSPEDAIAISAEIQRLQQVTQEARDAAAAADSDLATHSAIMQKLQLRFVPIIAVLLAHLVGAFVFFPRRIA